MSASAESVMDGEMGSGVDSDSSAMRPLRIPQERPRGLKDGRERRVDSSFRWRVLMWRVVEREGRGIRGDGPV